MNPSRWGAQSRSRKGIRHSAGVQSTLRGNGIEYGRTVRSRNEFRVPTESLLEVPLVELGHGHRLAVMESPEPAIFFEQVENRARLGGLFAEGERLHRVS